MVHRFLPLLLVAACASSGGEAERGQGEAEVPVPAAPPGTIRRTARDVTYGDVLEDLASADVVYVAGSREMQLSVVEYLARCGRLHAIALETFPRTAQGALDDFSFGRIDQTEFVKRRGTVLEADLPVLAFARERRLPVLALGVEAEILDAVATGGLGALSDEQRGRLPATKPVASELVLDVAADVVTRWYRDAAPEGAQVAMLVSSANAAPRDLLPERLFARNGKTYRTLVTPAELRNGEPSRFDRRYADYVWFPPEK
jgi:hypothetical protein